MTKPHALALGIGTAGLVSGAATFVAPFPFDWMLGWMALSCLLAAGAYIANRPDLLGKRNGRIAPLRGLPVLPYLTAIRIGCEAMRRVRRFPALSPVAHDLWVGGRCAVADLPPRLGLLVDLTAESSAPAPLRALPCYRNLPVLDGSVPPDEAAVLALLDEIAATRGAIVIHCDSGVGRAPTFAALALLRRGVAPDLAGALALVAKGRPMAHPTAVDRHFAERLAPRLVAAAEAAADPRPPARIARAAGA
jgi:Protein-tyrosine phosphatase